MRDHALSKSAFERSPDFDCVVYSYSVLPLKPPKAKYTPPVFTANPHL